MPWKNGGGFTNEIARHPHDAPLESILWRVSIANVDSAGPFSYFAGLDRLLMVLKGELELTFKGDSRIILTQESEPVRFAGSAMVSAWPATSVVDLNVMTRRGRVEAKIETLSSVQRLTTGPETLTSMVLCLAGTVSVVVAAQRFNLGLHDACEIDSRSTSCIEVETPSDSRVVLIQILSSDRSAVGDAHETN